MVLRAVPGGPLQGFAGIHSRREAHEFQESDRTRLTSVVRLQESEDAILPGGDTILEVPAVACAVRKDLVAGSTTASGVASRTEDSNSVDLPDLSRKETAMLNHVRCRRVTSFIAALLVCGALGASPAQAESGPIIPIIPPVIIGIPAGMSPVVVGIHGIERHEIGWSTSGRAHVDVDVDRSQQQGTVVGG